MAHPVAREAVPAAGRPEPWLGVGVAAGPAPIALTMLTLLDLVGTMLWGLGIPHDLVSALSRLAGLAGAGLMAASTVAYQRRLHGDCPDCSRSGSRARWGAMRGGPAPWWAVAGSSPVPACSCPAG